MKEEQKASVYVKYRNSQHYLQAYYEGLKERIAHIFAAVVAEIVGDGFTQPVGQCQVRHPQTTAFNQ